MRLTKTMYIVEEIEGEFLGYDPLGRPIYSDPQIIKTPFKAEIEPYSNKLAKTRYGVFVETTNRLFCEPNDKIVLNAKIEYNDHSYTVTENMIYDRHYEVLIKEDDE